jgi:hypothetical protein
LLCIFGQPELSKNAINKFPFDFSQKRCLVVFGAGQIGMSNFRAFVCSSVRVVFFFFFFLFFFFFFPVRGLGA